MNSEAPIDSQRRIDEQAAFWLLTLQSEELSEAERAAFVDWLRESPLHIARMLRICQLQRHLSTFKQWQRISRLGAAQPNDIIELFAVRPRVVPRPTKSRLRSAALLAASIVAVSIIGVLSFDRLNETEFRTQSGERREITLADNSVVDLAPDSDLVVRYRARLRLITLCAGEALFRVAKNPNRPFIVQAASTRVRAVGTVFNVERGVQGVSVTVTEGRVAVSQQAATRLPLTTAQAVSPVLGLGANEQVLIAPNGVASPIRAIAVNPSAGWETDQIVFDNEAVAEVAHRFNLHNQTKIDILDSQLAVRHISGVFQANDLPSFIAFIQAATDAKVSRPDPMHIVVGDTSHGGP
jgi:transmembrane sensor